MWTPFSLPQSFLTPVLSLAVLFAFADPTNGQDSVEFLNGATVQGKIIEIRKPQREFDFSTKVGGRDYERTYSYDQVHAVTFNGNRFVLTEKSAASRDEEFDGSVSRSKQEVMQIIEDAGRTLPDWFDSTELNYPPTLDLSWPLKASGKWDESKNVGQYIWGRINPNQRRWRSGIKLVHQCLERHKDDPELRRRDMQKLGNMYFTLLQDYPRAAFWYQQSDPSVRTQDGIHLAECYWRLGSRPMALAAMRGKSLNVHAIKLLSDMGEMDAATSVAKAFARSNVNNQAFLSLADGLRDAGRLDQAIAYYERVVAANDFRNKAYEKRLKARAQQGIEAIQLFDKADPSKVSDGSYQASSMAYNGDLRVKVNVSEGRIEDIDVVSHKEKQFYAALTDTPAQIIDKQSVRGIDGTSGATITSQAIITATAKALAKAQ